MMKLAAMAMFLGLVSAATSGAEPTGRIRVSEENPHYFKYKGEHVWPAGVNKGWHEISAPPGHAMHDWRGDITRNLLPHKVNFTRVTLFWPGDGAEGGELPWKKLADGRYDLARFNLRYWNRLKEYLTFTAEKDIIVNLEIWDEPAIERGGTR